MANAPSSTTRPPPSASATARGNAPSSPACPSSASSTPRYMRAALYELLFVGRFGLGDKCAFVLVLSLSLLARRRFALRRYPSWRATAVPGRPDRPRVRSSVWPAPSASESPHRLSPSMSSQVKIFHPPFPSPPPPPSNTISPHPSPVSFQRPSLPPVPSAPNAHRNPGPGQHVPPPPALLPKVAPG